MKKTDEIEVCVCDVGGLREREKRKREKKKEKREEKREKRERERERERTPILLVKKLSYSFVVFILFLFSSFPFFFPNHFISCLPLNCLTFHFYGLFAILNTIAASISVFFFSSTLFYLIS